MIRRYAELIMLPTFEERFQYLRIAGRLGDATFGFNRYLNQSFYNSREWRNIRHEVIVRDNACDLAFPGMELNGRLYIHHMNPLTLLDFEEGSDNLLNLEYLVVVSKTTHDAIHFGNKDSRAPVYVERKRGDTKLW